jgi:O-antigen ligase
MKVNEQVLGRRYSYFVNVLLFVFPVVINSVKVVGDLALFILAIAGIFIAISHRTSPFSIKELRVFSWLTLGYFLVICISVIFSGKAAELAHYIPRELTFLFAPFIGLAIYKAKINMRYLLLGIKVGLIISGFIVVDQYLDGHPRPSGVMNAEEFGNINVLLMFLAVSHFFDEGVFDRIFSIVAFSVGSFVMVVNGTRGAWVVFLVLMIVYSFFIYKKHLAKSKRAKITFLMIVFTILVGLGSTNIVQNRVNLTINNVSEWFDGGSDMSSVGIRFEMWSASARLIDDMPLTGYGYRNTNIPVSQYASDSAKKLIARFNHLHNDYLTHLIAAGFPGLIFVLALLFIPLRVFANNLRIKGQSSSGLMGVFLCLSFATIGLVTVVFGSTYMNALYVLLMAILMPAAITKNHPT